MEMISVVTQGIALGKYDARVGGRLTYGEK
jgi:hypothetical protein